jgi:protein-tyrosine-phosphatase
MKRVLFVDIRNAICSRMAEAWFNYLADGCGVAASCGTMPAKKVDLCAAQVMQEVKLDIQDRTTTRVNQQMLAQADIVVLMGKDIKLLLSGQPTFGISKTLAIKISKRCVSCATKFGRRFKA